MATRNVEYIIGLRDKFSSKMGNIQARTKALDGTMMRLRSTIGTLFTAFAAARVIGDIIKVGSNFEQLQISFETMLGSAEKAVVLIKDLTKFAIETPFELKDVAAGAKSLLAFGIANEKILPTLRSLGDVAAGLSVPIERLILNFGQVKAQTILTGRELRDFAIAGVPLLGELAKIMGKTTAEVKTLISTGDVGFEVVELAFRNMSGEGGKFFDLMRKQTKSTGGQISNLRDVVGLLENDLFKKFQPAINSVIVSIQDWIAIFRENIDTVTSVLRTLGDLIKLFIVYKAVQLSVNAIAGGYIAVLKLIKLQQVLMNRGLRSSIILMKGFRLALARTGIGLAVIALSALVILLVKFNNRATKAEKIQLRLKDAFEKINEKSSEQIIRIRELVKIIDNKTVADWRQRKALRALQKEFPNYFKGLDTEKAKLLDINKIQKELIENQKIRAILLERESLKEKLKQQKGLTFTTGFKEFGSNVGKLESERKEKVRKLQKLIFNLTKQAREIQDVARTAGIRDKIAEAKAEIAGATVGAGAAAGVGGVGITKITSAAPKIFNINIDSLIENFTISTTNLRDGTTAVKQQLTEAMLTMLSDVQIQVR